MKKKHIAWILLLAILAALIALAAWPRPAVAPHLPTDTPPAADLAAPDKSEPVNAVILEDNRCCAGGIAGEEIEIHAAFQAIDAAEMRVMVIGGCTSDLLFPADQPWEPFVTAKTFKARLPLNWVGFAVAAQYRSAEGSISPEICDEISLEGSPPAPTTAP